MDHVVKSGMEAHKSGMVSQNNLYGPNYKIRNRNCYGCCELGHFVMDCPMKRRNKSAQFKPKNQQKHYFNYHKPNVEAETKQIEEQFRDLQESRGCSDSHIEHMNDNTESSNYIRELENLHVLHSVEENPYFELDSSWEHILLEDDVMIKSLTKIGSLIDVNDLENVDVGCTMEENPSLESDLGWEHINFNQEDHI